MNQIRTQRGPTDANIKGVARDSSGSFDRRLFAYAAAAGASIAAGHGAQAAVMTTSLNTTVFNGSALIDVDGDGTDDYSFNHTSSFPAAANVTGQGTNQVAGAVVESPVGPPVAKASRLTGSTILPGGESFLPSAKLGGDGAVVEYGNWPGQSGYLGLQFDISGNTHYGFIQMSVESGVSAQRFAIHLDSASWEDVPNEPIHVVPEPAGLAVLALGAAGVLNLRPRRPA